jgi:dUTP pyrophosphatase
MEASKVFFSLLDKSAIVPKTHSKGAAGYDMHSIYAGVVPPFSIVPVRLGFSINLPRHLFGYLCGRSGIAKKFGVTVVNSYVRDRNEVIVYLKNYSAIPFEFEKGMRIAQLFFAILEDCVFEE